MTCKLLYALNLDINVSLLSSCLVFSPFSHISASKFCMLLLLFRFNMCIFLMFSLCMLSSRFMNQYFLLIACLQLWSLITPVNPASTWGPLIFIFAVSATKEAWDDYNRYLSDKLANEKEIWVVKNGIKKQVCIFFLQFFFFFWIIFFLSSISAWNIFLWHARKTDAIQGTKMVGLTAGVFLESLICNSNVSFRFSFHIN